MKKIITYSLLLLLVANMETGCKKELNNAAKNPNSPTSVAPNVLLTASLINVGYVAGGDLSRFEGLFDQQVNSGPYARQFNIYSAYGFTTTDFNPSWQNLYLSLFNFKDLRDSSNLHGYNTYSGIANVMMAYTLGLTTDVYGDVPYTQALQGLAQLQPSVDAQKDIYKSIQTLLDSGIARLGAANPGILTPQSDDVVYSGNAAEWTKLAYALKARYYLHLRKVDPSAVGNAMSAIANGFTSNSDDAYITYGGGSSSAGPWFQFLQQRPGELSFLGGNLAPAMINNNDARLAAFIDTSADQLGAFYKATSSGVQIMTYAEQLFIQAELDSIQGNKAQAATDYNSAVTASVNAFAQSNPAASAWLALNASETAATISLSKIINQKYIALFLNVEAYTDWRRTGYPTLSSYSVGSPIPRRFLYPQYEITANSHVAAVAGSITLNGKVWWDQ